ncbi:hypothetical protein J0X12_03440 [Sneathiella sp. CAU 1612]|uniref:Uncharacterized protein n=1 Tax=Sneathiella sedimenti TaxID=2816034 RepID=A0ABS3F3H0_9PROT|nr:hypothetical protein [Sneathiella sedimenti]MBO0332651.1 hypothetical protein [Sneathiella sedimenti]
MVVFRKVAIVMLTMLFAYMPVAVGAPLALDGTVAEKAVAGVTSVKQPVDKNIASTHQASAFALLNDKPTSNLVESKNGGGLMNSIPLSPALLLFGGALGAILWLGRRRKAENPDWEQ